MTKSEFLSELREALEGMVPSEVIEDNLRYYDNYFREQMEQGRSQEEIARELGSPRLLARTIEEASQGSQETETIYYDDEPEEEAGTHEGRGRVYTVNSTMVKLGCLLSAIVVLMIVYFAFRIFFKFLGPILIVCIVIYLIKEIIKK